MFDDFGSRLRWGKGVVRWHEQDCGSATRHDLGRALIRRVTANHDAEDQTTHLEYWGSRSRLVNGPVDCRVQLAIHTDDLAFGEDGRRIVHLTASAGLREAHNRRYGLAGDWREDRLKSAAPYINGDIGWSAGVIGQATKHGFRAAQDLHAHRLADPDLLRDQIKAIHRSDGQEWSLVCGDLHNTSTLVEFGPTCCVSAAAAHDRAGRRRLQTLVSRPVQC
jgi:hypothetical protein